MIKCILFDFYKTLSNDHYFKLPKKYNTKIAEVLFEDESKKDLLNNWWLGNISSNDIVQHLSAALLIPPEYLLNNLKTHARKMTLNKALFDFSQAAREKGYYMAIVTVNSDVFTTDVVPGLKLDTYFDCIINSSDHTTIDKNTLCTIAMSKLDNDLDFKDCLLLDDNEQNIQNFITLGGKGYTYTNDENFREWLQNNSDLVNGLSADMK